MRDNFKLADPAILLAGNEPARISPHERRRKYRRGPAKVEHRGRVTVRV